MPRFNAQQYFDAQLAELSASYAAHKTILQILGNNHKIFNTFFHYENKRGTWQIQVSSSGIAFSTNDGINREFIFTGVVDKMFLDNLFNTQQDIINHIFIDFSPI